MTRSIDPMDRLPPRDLDAEKAVLGSVILAPARLDDVADILSAQDFYADANRKIFSHLQTMISSGDGIDVTTLAHQLRQAGDMEAVGGAAYLAEVMQSVSVAAHAKHHAQLVRRKAQFRRLIHAGHCLVQAGYEEQDEPHELLAQTETALAGILDDDRGAGPVSACDATVEAVERIQAIHERRQTAGMFTGLTSFDEQIGGLYRGELFILAARPSIGKTALGCQVANHFAQQNRPVYFASLEMSAPELMTRVICAQSGVSSRLVRTAQLSDTDVHQLVEASQPLGTAPWWIHDRAGMTVPEIRRWAKRLARRDLHLVVVDYLQRLTPTDRRINRHEQIGQMTAGLKAMARELDVAVLCLAQLSREADKELRPRLSHLRESGSIEQDADVVAFLWRDRNKEPADPARAVEGEFIVAKNRSGETGALKVWWQASRTRFTSEYPATSHDEFRLCR